jgi:hypothetical protein
MGFNSGLKGLSKCDLPVLEHRMDIAVVNQYLDIAVVNQYVAIAVVNQYLEWLYLYLTLII